MFDQVIAGGGCIVDHCSHCSCNILQYSI